MVDGPNGVVLEASQTLQKSTPARRVDHASAGSSEFASERGHSEVLFASEFWKRLQVEKRRADRTKSALSLVVIRLDPERVGSFSIFDALINVLSRSVRETDVLGAIGKGAVGVLLPHTSDEGARAFIDGIVKRTAALPVLISSGTYPDQLFDRLMCDPPVQPDTSEFLFSEEAELSPSAAWIKRAMDIVGALTAIIAFSPVMLLAATAIAATSPGPVIFRQTRLGKGAVPFVIYKFRSMRIGTDDRIHREYVAKLIDGELKQINQGDQAHPLYKMSADPRVTPVGRIVRRTSIDELPQLFNVLKGDMSLVGPRPPLPYEAEKYQSWHLRRVMQIRPGITGLWQVEGRSTTSFDDMVRLDLRYIRQCSIWLDIQILLKTVRVVLRRDGAS